VKSKLGLVAGLVLATSITLAPLAFAQTVPPTPTCSQALDQLSTARAMPQGDVVTKQILLNQARERQIVLDKAEADAKVALDAFDGTPPVPTLETLTAAFNNARDAAAAGRLVVVAAEKALAADQKLVADRDAAVKAAEASVNKACRGSDGVVTTTPAAPTTTVVPVPTVSPRIPTAINTGLAA